MRLRSFVILVGLALITPAQATTLLRLDVDQLARAADAVITGTVTQTRSERDQATGLIVTLVSLTIERVLAGEAPPNVEVVTLGGRLGEIRQVVSGAAALEEGEEVALFLERLPNGRSRVVGMFEGQFRLEHGENGAEVYRSGGIPLYDAASQQYVPPTDLRLRLHELEQQVKAARSEP